MGTLHHYRTLEREYGVMSDDKRTNRSTRLSPQDRRRRGRGAITVQAGASPALAGAERVVRRADHREARPAVDFPDGLKFLPDERVLVFREATTFQRSRARLATHLGAPSGRRRWLPPNPSTPAVQPIR